MDMRTTSSRFSTLISDCDGVLIDSEVVAHEVLVHETQAVFPSVNVDALLKSSFGQKTEELVRQVARHAHQEIPDGFLRRLRILTDASIEELALPVANVDVLLRCPQLKAVVSNSGMARIMSAVSKIRLQRDDVKIYSADQVTEPKPSPMLYQLAAQGLAVAPEQCLVIEDSSSGVRAALAAGMSVLGFVGGQHIPPSHAADLLEMGVLAVFDEMEDLPQLLEQTAGWTVQQK